jgi:phosphoribosylglycinamide formyltransferase-1
MAGYMRVVSPELIDAFRDPRGFARVTNVHPSLLPAFPGRDAYGQAFRHGAKVSGVTVHLVDDGVDEGPICAQEAFGIGDCRSGEEVESRGLAIEHRLYPATLSWLLAESFEIEREEGRIRVRPT